MKSFFSFILGATIGGAVGYLLATLLTPASGAEVREQVSDTVQGIAGEFNNAIQERRKELNLELENRRHG